MPETWTRAAQELSPDDLPSYGRPTDEEAQAWMLDLLASEIEPRTHPARPAYFATNESWTTALAALEADGLITRPAASPQITDAAARLPSAGVTTTSPDLSDCLSGSSSARSPAAT